MVTTDFEGSQSTGVQHKGAIAHEWHHPWALKHCDSAQRDICHTLPAVNDDDEVPLILETNDPTTLCTLSDGASASWGP